MTDHTTPNPTPTPTLRVASASHLDHGLSDEQLAWLLARAEEHLLLYQAYTDDPPPPVLTLTLTLPESLGTVPCGLHGPAMGDAPLLEGDVTYAKRGQRGGQSRLCARPPQQVRKVSLIAGEHDGHRWVLYTAFGGPIAPREPFDLDETVPCPACPRSRGWVGTMDMPMPGRQPQPCPACKGSTTIPNPEHVESKEFWVAHALSA